MSKGFLFKIRNFFGFCFWLFFVFLNFVFMFRFFRWVRKHCRGNIRVRELESVEKK